VGITFLEETFSASTAPPKHRLHQKAARAVLNALLPESGSEIKGGMKSRADLLAASNYADQPREFDELIRILDSELRLVTPTDPDALECGDLSPLSSASDTSPARTMPQDEREEKDPKKRCQATALRVSCR
jgi:hypothetical protein